MKHRLMTFLLCCLAPLWSLAQSDTCGLDAGDKRAALHVLGSPIIPSPPVLDPDSVPGPPGNLEEENDRVIYWLHGFGGDANSWGQPAEATRGLGIDHMTDALPDFPARRAYCEQLDYNSFPFADSSLRNAAITILDQVSGANSLGIVQWDIDPAHNFMIAHSEGGLVSRDLERITESLPQHNKIGGLVTFGTSHGGARIINNKPRIYQLASDACEHLYQPMLSIFVDKAVAGTKPIWNFFLGAAQNLLIYPFLDAKAETIDSHLCRNFLPMGLGLAFADQLKKIGDDYAVGAPVVTSLDTFQTNIPKVLAYGSESDNHIWRVLHNMLIKKAVDYPLFEATDEETIEAIAKLQASMDASADQIQHNGKKKSIIGAIAAGLLGAPVIALKSLQGIKNSKEAADKIRAGSQFLGTMNERWLDIIGARVQVANTITSLKCVCTNPALGPEGKVYFPVDPQIECDAHFPPGSGWACQEVVTKTTVITQQYKPNDGIVLHESSFQFPGMNALRPMFGSNHMQMRNDGNTKDVLNDLYGGSLGLYFKTLER